MIKTEYSDDSDQYSQDSKPKSWQVITTFIVVGICLVGLASFIVIKVNSSKDGTLAPKNNKNDLNLVLPSSPGSSLKVSNPNPSSTTQSPASSTSLGSSSYNLQDNSPTSNNNQPSASSLQSTDSAQNTGQSINPNLPY